MYFKSISKVLKVFEKYFKGISKVFEKYLKSMVNVC